MASKSRAAAQKGLRSNIVALAKIYGHRQFEMPHVKEFIPGETGIPASGKVIGGPEIENAVIAALEGWFTEGHWTDEFEKKLAKMVKVRCASLTNSGSSANLLAISALTSPSLKKSERLTPGDEVIVAAAGFPTTLNPVIQNGLVPVFVDIELGTYVPSREMVNEALKRPRVRAIFLAHTLGNPVPTLVDAKELREKGIYLIEDNCDSLGSKFEGKNTGSIGVLATQSFYPAHHITMGEGGAVLTNRPKLKKIVESFRDWGRDCWCNPGCENTCGKRFEWDFPNLPEGYDHKFVYSHIGYNLKATDFQAAIGLAQLDRLPEFVQRRYTNFAEFMELMGEYEEFLILPKATKGSEPCWFGFPITVRDGAPFGRDEMVKRLNDRKIGTRNLFGGNLISQPAYRELKPVFGGNLHNSSIAVRQTFWFGCWPGIDEPRRTYMMEALDSFLRRQI